MFMTLTVVHAQTGSGYFNQAENLFKTKNYYEASVVFEKYLATEKNSRPRSTPFAIEKKVKGKTNMDPHQEAVYHLAESYRMINDYQKAEKYYKESIGFSGKLIRMHSIGMLLPFAPINIMQKHWFRSMLFLKNIPRWMIC